MLEDQIFGSSLTDRQLSIAISCPESQVQKFDHVNPAVLPIRDKAVNVIIRLVEAYESKAEALAHAIVLLDRLIATEFHSIPDSTTSQRMVKAAVGCYLIAVKVREVMHPCVRDLALLTSCTCEEIRCAEESVILALDWNVVVTTGMAACCRPLICNCVTPTLAAADIADKLLERCDEQRRTRLSKYVSFLVQLAYCCRELTTRYSTAAVAVACVVYSARILGDRSAEEELVPPPMRAVVDAAALDGLRNACRERGFDFPEALPPPPPAPADAGDRRADPADDYERTMQG